MLGMSVSVAETERLVIRRFGPGDLDDFQSYNADPVVRRYMKGEPMSAERAAVYLAAQAVLAWDTLDQWHGYALWHRADERVIGDVGVWRSAKPERAGTGDVGYQLHPGYHGQGYAYEAMTAFLPYVFDRISRVTAACHPDNVASWRLMRRLGMHEVEKSDDEVRYALSREQWAAR